MSTYILTSGTGRTISIILYIGLQSFSGMYAAARLYLTKITSSYSLPCFLLNLSDPRTSRM